MLARVLGPDDRGELAAVLLWPGLLAALASLGVQQATTFYAAREAAPTATIVTTALALVLVESVVAIAVGLAVLPFIFDSYSDSALGSAYLYLLFIPLNLAALFVMGVLNGLHRMRIFQILRILVIAVAAVVVLAAWIVGVLDVRVAVVAYVAANLITLIVGLLAVRRDWEGPARIDRDLGKTMLGFGVRSHTTTLSNFFNQRLDQLAISVFLGPASLGIYVVAVTLSSLTSQVGYSVALVALPSIARVEGEELKVEAKTFVAATLAVSTLISIPILIAAPLLVDIFFGSAYDEAANVARILLVGAIAFSVSRTLEAVLQGADRPLDAGIAEGGALLFTLIGLAVLLPSLDLIGAGLASLIAYTASVVFMVRRARVALELSPSQLMIPTGETLTRLREGFRRRVEGADTR